MPIPYAARKQYFRKYYQQNRERILSQRHQWYHSLPDVDKAVVLQRMKEYWHKEYKLRLEHNELPQWISPELPETNVFAATVSTTDATNGSTSSTSTAKSGAIAIPATSNVSSQRRSKRRKTNAYPTLSETKPINSAHDE